MGTRFDTMREMALMKHRLTYQINRNLFLLKVIDEGKLFQLDKTSHNIYELDIKQVDALERASVYIQE